MIDWYNDLVLGKCWQMFYWNPSHGRKDSINQAPSVLRIFPSILLCVLLSSVSSGESGLSSQGVTIRIGRFLVQTPLDARSGLEIKSLIILVAWFLVFEQLVFVMSLISLELLISFFAVLLLRQRPSHCFHISHDSKFSVYIFLIGY